MVTLSWCSNLVVVTDADVDVGPWDGAVSFVNERPAGVQIINGG